MTKSRRGLVVAVVGYGCHLTETVRKYLDSVAEYVRRQEQCTIITSGGFTNQKTAPDVSEAEMMASYLRGRGIEAEIILDKAADTTNENILGIARVIKERGLSGAEIVIFCNWAHAAKVACAAWWVLGEEVRVETCFVTRSLRENIKQLLVTPLNVLATFIPWLRTLEKRRKKRIMARS